MKERIIKIMEAENLTPSLFADKLNIGRAVISHILNGRNNPSLDVVIRILDTVNYIDADWLLSGKGSMFKSDNMPQNLANLPAQTVSKSIPTDLFGNNTPDSTPHSTVANIAKETAVASNEVADNSNLVSSMLNAPNKKISKMIVYYSDNTFQAFNPENTPL